MEVQAQDLYLINDSVVLNDKTSNSNSSFTTIKI